MSILIRGMEMPKEEELLCIRIYPNGKVSIDMDLACKQIATAVPIPAHGRLGDLDELSNRFVPNQAYFTENIIQKISATPTIIKAEGEEEDEKID